MEHQTIESMSNQNLLRPPLHSPPLNAFSQFSRPWVHRQHQGPDMLPKGRLNSARRNLRALHRHLHRQRHNMGNLCESVEENSEQEKGEGGAASNSLAWEPDMRISH